MAPKKKQVKNAFFFFMQEVKRDEEEKGRVFHNGMREVSEYCSGMWNAMDAEEKEPYSRMAADAKKQKHEDLTKKFTSLGVSYADLEAEEREKERANQIMTDTVQRMVRSLPRDREFKDEQFFLCHVNYFYVNDKGVFYPAEIAMAVFSLRQGLIRSLHSFVDPGKIHLGYRFEASNWAQKSHNIPLDENTWTCGEKDYCNLYYRIKSLLQVNDRNRDSIPPIFTMPDSLNNNTSISAVKSFFQTMCEAAGEDPSIFRIYPLPLLFFEMRNHSVPDDAESAGDHGMHGPQVKLPTVAMADHQLQRDVFAYAKNIACEYHEEKDLTTFCSLAVVTRWIFTVCDYCCMLLGIQLIPKKHCPIDADINAGARGWEASSKQYSLASSSSDSETKEKDSSGISNNFMPTIIDHGKLREQFEAEYGPSTSSYLPPTSDVPLPKNTSYSAAIKKSRTASSAGPELTKSDFPIVSDQKRRFGVGRGRGMAERSGPPPALMTQPPNWPVSGRGSRMNCQ